MSATVPVRLTLEGTVGNGDNRLGTPVAVVALLERRIDTIRQGNDSLREQETGQGAERPTMDDCQAHVPAAPDPHRVNCAEMINEYPRRVTRVPNRLCHRMISICCPVAGSSSRCRGAPRLRRR